MKPAVLALAATGLAATGWAAPASKALQISVTAGDVTDRRRNDNSFAELEIQLKLVGEGIDGAKGARALVRKAVDDTGRNLLSEEKKTPDFEKATGEETPVLKLSLKNPARRAGVVKEVSGQLEVFLPGRDTSAVARVDKFLSRVDQPLSAAGLKAAQAQVTVVSRKTYEAEKKKNEERRKKGSESAGFAGAMVEAFAGLFEGLMGDIGENDVLLRVSDKGKKIFSVEVLDAEGKKIDDRGSMKVSEFWILNFAEKLPADASLRIYVLTPTALVSSPFSLKDIPLP